MKRALRIVYSKRVLYYHITDNEIPEIFRRIKHPPKQKRNPVTRTSNTGEVNTNSFTEIAKRKIRNEKE